MIFFKILLLLCFAVIFYQDYKSRYVYWFLYPLTGICAFAVQTENNTIEMTLLNNAINLAFISLFLLIAFLYSWQVMKVSLTKEALGIGDILFFIFIAFSFAPVAFLILFVFALFFSLAVHIVLKEKQEFETIPLAGYMALFFGIIYLISFFTNLSAIYAF